jgi:phage gp36-like protein
VAYATYTDVESYARSRGLAELFQETGIALDAGGQTRINAEATEQSQFMDGFLIAKHDVPVTAPAVVLAILKTHCCRLVVRGGYADRDLAPEFVRVEAEETVEWLKAIAKTGIAGVTARAETELSDQSIDAETADQVFGLADAFL